MKEILKHLDLSEQYLLLERLIPLEVIDGHNAKDKVGRRDKIIGEIIDEINPSSTQ